MSERLLAAGLALVLVLVPLTANAFGYKARLAFHVVALGLGAVATGSRRARAWPWWLWPLVGMLGWGWLRVPAAPDRAAALAQMLDRTALWALLVATAAISDGGRRRALGAGLIGMGLVAVWGLLQTVGIHPFLPRSIWEPSAPTRPLGTHNLMGGFLVAWLPMAVVWATTARGAAGWVGWGATVVGWACLLQTVSRGAWLAAAVAGAWWLPWMVRGWRQRQRAQLRRRVVVLGVLVALIGAASAAVVVERLQTPEPGLASGTESSDVASAASGLRRRWIAGGAVEAWRAAPWWGHGPGAFGTVFYAFKPDPMRQLEAVTGQTAYHAHADLLELGVEYGWVGVVLVLISLAGAMRAAGRWVVRRGDGGALELWATVSAVVVGGTALGLHALIDFDMHEVPTAMVAGVFLGVLASQSGKAVAPARGWRWGAGLGWTAACGAALAAGGQEALYHRAFAQTRAGELAAADRSLSGAEAWGPDRDRYAEARAQVAGHLAKAATSTDARQAALRQAAEHYERLAELKPGEARAAHQAALAWERVASAGGGGLNEAVGWAGRARQRNPYAVSSHLLEARLRRQAGDVAGARAALEAGRTHDLDGRFGAQLAAEAEKLVTDR